MYVPTLAREYLGTCTSRRYMYVYLRRYGKIDVMLYRAPFQRFSYSLLV